MEGVTVHGNVIIYLFIAYIYCIYLMCILSTYACIGSAQYHKSVHNITFFFSWHNIKYHVDLYIYIIIMFHASHYYLKSLIVRYTCYNYIEY